MVKFMLIAHFQHIVTKPLANGAACAVVSNTMQNDYAHLIGSERTETYQTYKWVTPSYPEPWDPQCQNRQPVKVPYTVSYSISEGNDGFLNNTTEQMPLRLQTRFEDNFKAEGANHFTEGNHPDVLHSWNSESVTWFALR